MIAPSLRPFAERAELEAEELLVAVGGGENTTPQVKVLVHDTSKLGLLLQVLLAKFLRDGGEGTRAADMATRIGTLAGVRRANLPAIGLARFERPVPSIVDYMAARAAQKARTRIQNPA